MTHVTVQKQLLFIHISKTAGTSFFNCLANNVNPDESALYPVDVDLKQKKYRLFGGHYSAYTAERCFSHCDWLTIVRDPIDRAISQYRSWHDSQNLTPYWIARITPDERKAVEIAQSMSFEQFLNTDNAHLLGSISNHQCRVLCSLPPERTAATVTITDYQLGKAVLASAKNNLFKRLGFFEITEQFSASLELFVSKFRIAEVRHNQKLRLNTSGVDRPVLSQWAKGRLQALNEFDMELYFQAKREFARRLKRRTILDNFLFSIKTNLF